MSSKFNHCFVYADNVYGTPYSFTGDMMDQAELVCSWGDDRYGVNNRTARILSEMCLYWGILTNENYSHMSVDGPMGGYYIYALKHFYSLAYRIESIWGEYAARAIFNTCGFIF